MPIYEYKCKECGHNMEALQKISAAPLTDCPECNKPGLEKLVSAAAFQLKGDGWYVTDFRDKGKSADTAGTKAGSTSVAETTATGTEA
ncbi:MAG: transcriptional regulator [Legionellales bacterium]|nr:transcriptional regulator [Legionellales bacterium]|tara:strand:- start:7652 stop:7915 length:264 start_codon:yes stop_codon:yes gene_type:complete